MICYYFVREIVAFFIAFYMVIFMINNLSTKIAHKFFDDTDKYPIQVYIYGIELLISSAISTLVIFLIGFLTNTFFESVVFLISFSAVRVYTGGYHSMTYLRCNIISALSYIAIVAFLYIFKDFIANPIVMLSCYAFTMVLAMIFAPVKHENKDMSISDMNKYKTLSLLMITVVFTISCVGYYILKLECMLVIIPTFISIDIAMIVSIVNNKIISRRKRK